MNFKKKSTITHPGVPIRKKKKEEKIQVSLLLMKHNAPVWKQQAFPKPPKAYKELSDSWAISSLM